MNMSSVTLITLHSHNTEREMRVAFVPFDKLYTHLLYFGIRRLKWRAHKEPGRGMSGSYFSSWYQRGPTE